MAKAAAQPVATAPAIRSEPGKGSQTVTVASKFPAAIILQACRESTWYEETREGRVKRNRFDKAGPTFTVRGTSQPNGQLPKGYRRPNIEGGYALTRGVPRDLWETWLAQNQDTDLVKNKVIFASPDHDELIGLARDHEHVRSGLEPLNPDGDPRAPKSLNPQVGNIETAEIG